MYNLDVSCGKTMALNEGLGWKGDGLWGKLFGFILTKLRILKGQLTVLLDDDRVLFYWALLVADVRITVRTNMSKGHLLAYLTVIDSGVMGSSCTQSCLFVSLIWILCVCVLAAFLGSVFRESFSSSRISSYSQMKMSFPSRLLELCWLWAGLVSQLLWPGMRMGRYSTLIGQIIWWPFIRRRGQ